MTRDDLKGIGQELDHIREIPDSASFLEGLKHRLEANTPAEGFIDLSELAPLPSPSTGDFSRRLNTTLTSESERLSEEDLAIHQKSVAETLESADGSYPDLTLATPSPDLRIDSIRSGESTWGSRLGLLLLGSAIAGAIGWALGNWL